jgi:hypothetical protein
MMVSMENDIPSRPPDRRRLKFLLGVAIVVAVLALAFLPMRGTLLVQLGRTVEEDPARDKMLRQQMVRKTRIAATETTASIGTETTASLAPAQSASATTAPAGQ